MRRFVPSFRISFFILISSVCCLRCRPVEGPPAISIVSKNDKAVGVAIRGVDLHNHDLERLKVRLVKPGQRTPVLGEFRNEEGQIIIFESLVPLTRGLRYEVLLDDTLLSEIEIPVGDFNSPQLLSVYPTQDTLPENLLKMYFEFSEPMVEGSSLTHLTLIQDDRDTLKGTFLDLQPELWNAEGTVLTLWLDPGRIKRDLIPNKEFGAPLIAGGRYTLHIRRSWHSKNGHALSGDYSKTFVTTVRDDHSPDLAAWRIVPPAFEKKGPLEIQFPHSLDYFLLMESITIKDPDDVVVPGQIEVDDEERIFRFLPAVPWSTGRFTVHVESRLEDLAGNNLNRPFDRMVDIESDEYTHQEQKIFIKEFEVR